MNIGYTILDPKHKKYQIGTMFFEYEEEGFLGLKRIGFIIDNEKFFVNTALTGSRSSVTAWLFIKDGTYHAPTTKELDHMLALTNDVLNTFEFQKSLCKILEALRHNLKFLLNF